MKGIYEAMHRRYLIENGGKPRWGQKTPNNLYFVPQILECFPNAQFIFIVRDGRDAAVTSLSSAFGAGNIWGAAYTWDRANAFVKSFREQYDGSMWIDVKYEQLCREPEKVLRTVCEFPEGHPDEEIIVGFRAWKKWKKHFSIQRRYFR